MHLGSRLVRTQLKKKSKHQMPNILTSSPNMGQVPPKYYKILYFPLCSIFRSSLIRPLLSGKCKQLLNLTA